MTEILIAVVLVALVFVALWTLSRRAKRGGYPATKSLHMPGPSMDVTVNRFSAKPAEPGWLEDLLKKSPTPATMTIGYSSVQRKQDVDDPCVGHFEPRPVQKRLDAALKQALRSMSDESLRAFSPEAGDTQAKRLRKLELDRRSREARRHVKAARKAFESIQNGCKDSILSKAERDSLMPQGWDANGSPT